ncbi:hypothetical protein VIGAN_UM018300 [Vigna angularis var. angularis]|uniref:Uncharacterized protein n=1 Tax=Vigna angularis var. angularis TaxID=157739 RepID=A0A0S3TDJ6_PHAAN|nr:hypothetical protein VIGAN_UM018300 [Vigna angularis var. angularis]
MRMSGRDIAGIVIHTAPHSRDTISSSCQQNDSRLSHAHAASYLNHHSSSYHFSCTPFHPINHRILKMKRKKAHSRKEHSKTASNSFTISSTK